MAYQIQYKGVWAGAESRDWSPAVTGTLNQSNDSDIFASTFNDLDVARAYLEDEILTVADDRVEFRIIEIPMTFDRDGAIEALRSRLATSVYYLDRDATCGHYCTIRCWLEDGDLVQAHPTDVRRSPISAPADVRYYNYIDTEE